MILLMDTKSAQKKKFKKIYKVIISLTSKEIDKRSAVMTSLVPQPKTFNHFVYGDFKKYKKSYLDMIKQNDDLFSTLLTIVLAYKSHGKLILTCDKDEYGYGYLLILANYINKRYGIKFVEDASKIDVDEIKKSKIKEDKLRKDITKYADLIFGTGSSNYIETIYENKEYADCKNNKKNKKKKSKHKKNKKYKDKINKEKVKMIKLIKVKGDK